MENYRTYDWAKFRLIGKAVNNMTDGPEAQQSILSRIRWMSSYMNPALRRIADRVLKKPEDIKSITTKDLAAECDVSGSTITRFVRELNVPSFQKFKVMIAEELSLQGSTNNRIIADHHIYEDITEQDDISSIISKITARYILTAEDTNKGLSMEELARAVEAIEACQLMSFFATGSSLICVENALMRFMRIGKACQFFRDIGVRQISTATLNEKSLAIGISNSGRTITTVNALKVAKEQGAKTLCITSFPDSPIVKYADIKLFTPTVSAPTGTADYEESMVSKMAQLQVIDVLYSIYAVRNIGSAVEILEQTSEASRSTRY